MLSKRATWEEHVDGLIYWLMGKVATVPAIVGPMATFVFQPGGTAGGNVFTTWASLMAAVALSPGPKTVLVDDSLAAAHATTGAWSVDEITFVGRKWFGSTLIVDTGSVWSAMTFRVQQGLTISSVAAAAVLTTAGNLAVYCEEVSSIVASAAAPFFAQTAGSVLLYGVRSNFGDATHPVISVAAGATTFFYLNANAALANNGATGLGTIQQLITDDCPLAAQPGIGVNTIVLLGLASNVSFTPAIAGNWQPAPTQVKAALDQLAAPNVVQQVGNTGTGSATVTVTTGNITKAKNGSMQVSASALITVTGAATLTVQLKRDAANIGTAQTLVLGGATSLGVSASFVDTAPDAAAHTYTLSLSVGANTITCAANSAQISVSEGS